MKALGLGKRCIYNWLCAVEGQEAVWAPDEAEPGPDGIAVPDRGRYDAAAASVRVCLWTIQLVQWLIHDEWRIKLSRSSVHRLMRQLGLSCQRRLRRAYKQDPVRMQRWRNEEFPAIRKMAKEAGAEIWFGDESGVRSDRHSGNDLESQGQPRSSRRPASDSSSICSR